MQDDLTPDCHRFQNELPSLLYEELSPEARAAVELHLAACGACRDELAALRELRALLARWETPPSGEDPRRVAREVAALARAAAPHAARRVRLVRWSALAAGAAAALLFTFSLLNASIRAGNGELEIRFALPGAHAHIALEPGLEQRLRAIAAQEVATRAATLAEERGELLRRCSDMTQQELLRLSQAVDMALAQNLRAYDTRLVRLGREAALADLEQRRVITDLAAHVIPVSNTPR